MNTLSANIAAIGQESQDKLQRAKVLITNSNLTAEFLTMQLVGLGIGHIMQESKNGITTKLNLNSLAQTTLEQLVTIPNYIRTEFNPTHIIESQKYHSAYESLAHATLTCEQLRSSIAPLNEEPPKSQAYIIPPIRKQTKPKEGENRPSQKEKTLLIGAGGIGTYLALLHCLESQTPLDILDYDTVESANLNRQLLYANSIGKPKATSLANTLTTITNTKCNAIEHRITSPNDVETLIRDKPYSQIYICTDNPESRSYASHACEKTKSILIEGACNTKAASANIYRPNRSPPIHRQKDLTQKIKKSQSCSTQANPSIVIPNAMAAVLMYNLANSTNQEASYNSFSKQIDVIQC